jgi:replicative DNA helicase
VFAESEPERAVWGSDGQVVWPSGEPFYICGQSGVGKTTLAQQLVLARIGLLPERRLLGLPVAPDPRPVLYIAADRPRQAKRSLARMVSEDDAVVLNDQLRVWKGPLPFLLSSDPRLLAEFAQGLGAGTLVLDSLGNVATDLTSDETGGRVNLALQEVVAAGIEVLVLHHPRKAQTDNRKPSKLEDMYGSTWLGNGAGSVIFLYGSAGDPVVELIHVKQPVEEVGPFHIVHDHVRGRSRVEAPVDLVELMYDAGPPGVTVQAAARAIYAKQEPLPAEVEKARRQLDKLEAKGKALKIPPATANDSSRWVYNGPKGARP